MTTQTPHVLMYGWEYPPFNSGGLGTACYGLSQALVRQNLDLTFVLPRKITVTHERMQFAFAHEETIDEEYMHYLYNPYLSTALFERIRRSVPKEELISTNLIQEVHRYSIKARKIATSVNHSIIHAHDWLSFGAGIEARSVSQKPLIAHIHATEYDRTGFRGVHPYIHHVEKEGMKRADHVVAVSEYTKRLLTRHYEVPAHRISVVHNGIHHDDYQTRHDVAELKRIFGKIVLFVGRLTLQKGPDYFVQAAKKVLEHEPNTTFVIAGSGDAEEQIIRDTVRMGIAGKVFFTGFLRGDDLNKLFQAADLYIMPSVSEPFGIAALEAAANHTPVLVSRQTGVSEVLSHSLQADFWDTDEMANKILAVLRYQSLRQVLSENSRHEVAKCSWDASAQKMAQIYQQFH